MADTPKIKQKLNRLRSRRSNLLECFSSSALSRCGSMLMSMVNSIIFVFYPILFCYMWIVLYSFRTLYAYGFGRKKGCEAITEVWFC